MSITQETNEDMPKAMRLARPEYEDEIDLPEAEELPPSNIFHGLSFSRGKVKFTEFYKFIQKKTGKKWLKYEDARTMFDYLKYRVRSKKLPYKQSKNDLPIEAVLEYEFEGKTLDTELKEILDTARQYREERHLRRKKYKPLFAFMGLSREKSFIDIDQFYSHISKLDISEMSREKCDRMFYLIDKERQGKISHKELSYYRMKSHWTIEMGLNKLLEMKDGVVDDRVSTARSVSRSSTHSRFARSSTSKMKQQSTDTSLREVYDTGSQSREWTPAKSMSSFRRYSFSTEHKQAPSVSQEQDRDQEWHVDGSRQSRSSAKHEDDLDGSRRSRSSVNREDDLDSKQSQTNRTTPPEIENRYWKQLDTNNTGHVGQIEFIEWVRGKVPDIFRETDILFLFAMMDKNGSGQITKREFLSVIVAESDLSQQLQHILLKEKPMVGSVSSFSTRDKFFDGLQFDEAGNVKLRAFREWFLVKLQEESVREVLEYEISRLFLHLGARHLDDFLSSNDLREFERKEDQPMKWCDRMESWLKESASVILPSIARAKGRTHNESKESVLETKKDMTSSRSRKKRLLPHSRINNSVYSYTGKHIFDEISIKPGFEVAEEDFIHFVTEKWSWVNRNQAVTAFKLFTDGKEKLTRRKYFQKINKVKGRSELDSFLTIIKADLSNAEVPIGNFCNYRYQARLDRQEKIIKDLGGWKDVCKTEITKWQTRAEIAEKKVIDLKVQMRVLREAFTDLEQTHFKDTRLIAKLRKENEQLSVVTFRVFNGIETNEHGFVTKELFVEWFVERVPWAYPMDAESLFKYVGNGAEEIDMETIRSFTYNTTHTSFHAKVKALLSQAGPAPGRPNLLFDSLEYNFKGETKLSEFYNWMREKASWVSFVDTEQLFDHLDIECCKQISRRQLDKFLIETSFEDALHQLVKESGGSSEQHGLGLDFNNTFG